MSSPTANLLAIFQPGTTIHPEANGIWSLIDTVASSPNEVRAFRLAAADLNAAVKVEIRVLLKLHSANIEREATYRDFWVEVLDRYVATVCAGAIVAGMIADFTEKWKGGFFVAGAAGLVLVCAAATRFWVKSDAIHDRRKRMLIDLMTDI